MNSSRELDVETVLEALQALNDGIAIYGPDDRQLFVNEIAYRRFRTYYQAMADGMTHMEALAAQFRQALPDASETEIAEAAQGHFVYFQNGETYLTKTEDGRSVLATFRQMCAAGKPVSRSTSPISASARRNSRRPGRPLKQRAIRSLPSLPT
jgi:hypothetical protein